VHRLQGKAERVTAHDQVLALLQEFHRERLTFRQRHVAVARGVSNYAFNNTYQYIINREDVHLQWLEAAIAELGATPAEVPEPTLAASDSKHDAVAQFRQDASDAAAHVARWRPRLGEVTNARHRSMLGVILGETLEQ
jgi:hypothetical protein